MVRRNFFVYLKRALCVRFYFLSFAFSKDFSDKKMRSCWSIVLFQGHGGSVGS